MRRVLSIFLLLFLALPLVAPALGQTTQRRVMLCCLRGGAHRCMASATMEDGQPAPALRARCPASPSPAVTGHAANWIIGDALNSTAADSVMPLRIRQAEAGYRISFHCSRQKRGPPAFVVS